MRWRFGLLAAVLSLPAAAGAGEYAPLSCAKAKSATETTICKNYDLGQLDARMATLYAIATSLAGMGRRGDLQDEQREWIKTREACGADVSCLKKTYDERIKALSGVIDDVASRGPF